MKPYQKSKILFTLFVAVLVLGLLLWQHNHGGVPSHHILHQNNLPSISNWWSAVLLPVFTWILLTRIENRLKKQNLPNSTPSDKSSMVKILALFFVGLSMAILITISFVLDIKPISDNLLYLFLVLSFVLPIYYSEFILGFILGMTYIFGAILPTGFVLLWAAFGLFSYRYIGPYFVRLIRVARSKVTSF